MRHTWYGINRTWCDTLDEIEDIAKNSTSLTNTTNMNTILSLCTELRVYGNRMEAGLNDIHDLDDIHKEIKAKRKELESLKGENNDEQY